MIGKNIVETVINEMQNFFPGNDIYFSKTRDVFLARLQSYILETKKYLESAIIGEIGNNTFDHNFGFDAGLPKGVYLNTEYLQKYTVIADYGKGLKQSLRLVLPIASDMEAIETAFTKRVSGRSPEQRGNGLKFVSETIQQNNWHLYFQSGAGSCLIDRNGIQFIEKNNSLTGCLAIIDFNGGE
uniref:Uncharacterized protein n=1 Tax=uncultured bacterium contig00026 TaxID=1181515 RepID=A0A806KAR7_9BACT|nr:hypothetical protein [uncultured bacterium contig00026]